MEFTQYLQSGSEGDDVKELQESLKRLGFKPGRPDGVFGGKTEAAVLEFQKSYGMYDDGVVGENLVNVLNEALATDRPLMSKRLINRGDRGEDVRVLQNMLNELGFDAGSPDGIFGKGTLDAVVAFQYSQELKGDGLVGFKTVDALFRAHREMFSDDGSNV